MTSEPVYQRPPTDGSGRAAQENQNKYLKKTKITDINSDCLENIFEKLDIGSLLQVADSNKWLQVSAASVFSRKFGQHRVQLSDIYPKYNVLSNYDGKIVVGGLKTCLQFLRCFGETVKKLDISFVDSTKKHHLLMDAYVNEFCVNSLVELDVYGRLTSFMKDISKPFSAIEYLCFEECVLESNVTRFNVWFPNLRNLVLFSNCLNPICIEVSLPNLEHLATEINHGRSSDIGKDNIEKTLCLNAQLRSLNIRVDTAQKILFDDFLAIISKGASIEKLQTHWNYEHSFQISSILPRIAMTLPSLRELHFTGLVFKNNEIAEFLDQHKMLKKFSFALFMKSTYKSLQVVLGHRWKVSRNHNYLITLER